LAEIGEAQDRVLVDQPLVNVPSVDIQFRILVEHHVPLLFAPNVV
jgi:hypothetical protein